MIRSIVTTAEVEEKGFGLEVVRRFVRCGPMQRLLQEGLLGPHRWYNRASAADVATSGGSAIWVLGVCYQVSGTSVASDCEAGGAASAEEAYNAFLHDFSSRLWITYRKGVLLSPSLLLLFGRCVIDDGDVDDDLYGFAVDVDLKVFFNCIF